MFNRSSQEPLFSKWPGIELSLLLCSSQNNVMRTTLPIHDEEVVLF